MRFRAAQSATVPLSLVVACHRALVGSVTCLVIWLAMAPEVRAQSPENVAVVVNDNSAESQRIGAYYAKTRGLPPSNVLRIQTSTDVAIERNTYVTTIERPLGLAISRAGLQDRLLYLVLTKGIPLRIAGATGLSGTAASVDSELTLLYRRLVGLPFSLAGTIDNPYYLGAREIGEALPFSHREHDIYLVTRIDAFTVDQALALVDRAQAPGMEGRILLDKRGKASSADPWIEKAAKRVTDQEDPSRVVVETSGILAREAPVLGYYSVVGTGLPSRPRQLGLGFTSGSIAANLASFDARTFRQPPDDWQPTASPEKSAWFEGSGDPLIGDLIREGVSGVSGQVGESYVLGAVRPEILFPAYLAGFNLAEAFYLALPTLSWQTIVVGDPLCAPFGRRLVAREQVEEVTDPSTGLPRFFATRRLAAVRALNPEFPEEAIPFVLKSQALVDRDGARSALQEAVRLAPRAVSLMIILAQLEDMAGEYDAAIARYRRILELEPANVAVLNNLAFALAVRREAPAEALPFARRAASLAPKSGAILDTLGWVEHLLGNHAEAATLMGQAVQLQPGQVEIRLHAAIIYAAIEKVDRAEAELKEAIRIDPAIEGREEARQLRERIAALKPIPQR